MFAVGRRRLVLLVTASVLASCATAPQETGRPTPHDTPVPTETPAEPTPEATAVPLARSIGAIAWGESGSLFVIADGSIRSSNDLGRTWSLIALPSGSVPVALAATPDALLVVSTDDPGADPSEAAAFYLERRGVADSTWTQTLLASVAGTRAAIAVSGSNEALVLLGAERHGSDTSFVTTSVDDGRTWTALAASREPLLAQPVLVQGGSAIAGSVDPNGDTSLRTALAVRNDVGAWSDTPIEVPANFSDADRTDVIPLGETTGGAWLAAATYAHENGSVFAVMALDQGAFNVRGTLDGLFPDAAASAFVNGEVMTFDGGNLWVSTDAGQTWNATPLDLPGAVVGVSFLSPEVGVIEVQGQTDVYDLRVTSDAGRSWNQVLATTP